MRLIMLPCRYKIVSLEKRNQVQILLQLDWFTIYNKKRFVWCKGYVCKHCVRAKHTQAHTKERFHPHMKTNQSNLKCRNAFMLDCRYKPWLTSDILAFQSEPSPHGHSSLNNTFTLSIRSNNDKFLTKISTETQIFAMERSDKDITIHFIF